MEAVVAIVCLVGLVISFVEIAFDPGARLARAIRVAPRRTIADVPDGAQARIVGVVEEGARIAAPRSGRACVLYEVVAERYRSDGDGGAWHAVGRETGGVPFTLRDGTGRALVDPANAWLILEPAASRGSEHGQTLRYREGIVAAGDTIAVFGPGVREPDPDGAARASGYRELPPTRLHVAGSARLALVISNGADDLRR
jgi:hypothetical protein